MRLPLPLRIFFLKIGLLRAPVFCDADLAPRITTLKSRYRVATELSGPWVRARAARSTVKRFPNTVGAINAEEPTSSAASRRQSLKRSTR
jgi:hypothetical protein